MGDDDEMVESMIDNEHETEIDSGFFFFVFPPPRRVHSAYVMKTVWKRLC